MTVKIAGRQAVGRLARFMAMLGLMGLLAACSWFSAQPAPPPAQATETPGMMPSSEASPTPSSTAVPAKVWPEDVAHLGTSWADFGLSYDHDVWDRLPFEGLPGLHVLEHRTLEGCSIIPNIPVGLGERWTVEDAQWVTANFSLITRRFFQDGALKFVGYYGFLGNQDGAVEVHFEGDGEDCLVAAEELFFATKLIRPEELPDATAAEGTPLSSDSSSGQPPALATPYAMQPAAGVCASFEDEWVVVSINPDIPDPRCARVAASQKLKVINRTQGALQVGLGHFLVTIEPGEEHGFDLPFGDYLAPGVHQLQVSPCCGLELWLGAEPQ